LRRVEVDMKERSIEEDRSRYGGEEMSVEESRGWMEERR
jgi:hypothetical protein